MCPRNRGNSKVGNGGIVELDLRGSRWQVPVLNIIEVITLVDQVGHGEIVADLSEDGRVLMRELHDRRAIVWDLTLDVGERLLPGR